MKSRPVIVSPDSFKGTFSASEVAGAIAEGLREGGIEAVELPIGDGGEGTLDAVVEALDLPVDDRGAIGIPAELLPWRAYFE